MELRDSSLYLQNTAIGHYSEPPSHSYLSKIYHNIILLPGPKFPTWSLLLRCSNQNFVLYKLYNKCVYHAIFSAYIVMDTVIIFPREFCMVFVAFVHHKWQFCAVSEKYAFQNF